MTSVKQIIPLDSAAESSSISLGGNAAQVSIWPVNPEGEALILVAAINCANFKVASGIGSVPEKGILYIFSTYSKSSYFLENITYDGDPLELDGILSGYTKVILSNGEALNNSPGMVIPETYTKLKEIIVGDDDFPVFSMTAQEPPNGFDMPEDIGKEYDFVLQLYSSDFPEPFKDIFYLTDAVGYLVLKKNCSGEGLFFVQTG